MLANKLPGITNPNLSSDFLKLRMDSMSVPIEFFHYEEMREHILNGGLPAKKGLLDDLKTLHTQNDEAKKEPDSDDKEAQKSPVVPPLNLPRDSQEEMRHVIALARIVNESHVSSSEVLSSVHDSGRMLNNSEGIQMPNPASYAEDHRRKQEASY